MSGEIHSQSATIPPFCNRILSLEYHGDDRCACHECNEALIKEAPSVLGIELFCRRPAPEEWPSTAKYLEALLFDVLKDLSLLFGLTGNIGLYQRKRNAVLRGESSTRLRDDYNLPLVASVRVLLRASAEAAELMIAERRHDGAASPPVCRGRNFALTCGWPLLCSMSGHDVFASAEKEEARLQRSLSRVRKRADF